ncbi:PQQ-like beta-propeller repeat protein [Altererythrobacter sp. ZODW24]|uniref:PQQ-like beta-propeller repeat protein n=1 Tax=Altererythrobacter sp. ZODW24 TaxID=2185142 RepID=UPI000DF822DE|nr:PQQ-like beta-propeller repeat protein [Altererythrobacter sp. ZODW24]
MISRKAVTGLTRNAMMLTLAAAVAGCGVLGGKDPKTTPTVGNRSPILSQIESGAVVDPALASVAVVLPPAQVNADWAQVGGTASKSYGHLALSAAPSRAWTSSVEGGSNRRRLAASPVVGGGAAYLVGTDGMVHALDAATGAKRWTAEIGIEDSLEASAFGGGASYDAGRIYATDGVGDVVALDATNGSQLWKVKPAGPLRGSPTLAFNSVFVMTQANEIFSLNAADGTLNWQDSGSQGQAGVFGVAAPAAAQGSVIAGYSSGELVAHRYENGRVLWSDALSRTSISTQVGTLTDIDADPIIDRGRVYALGQGGRMAAYELVTGQRIWELSVAGISTPAIAGEWIFALTDQAQLLAIARTTGKIRWLTQLPQFKDMKDKKGRISWVGPVLAGGRLWLANSRGQVVSAAVEDGSVTDFVRLDDAVSLPPVVANQTLYVLDEGGKIHAFR